MTPELKVHKAVPVPASARTHCQVCGQRIRQVPGGQGTTWVHSDSGAVAAPNPPTREVPPPDVTPLGDSGAIDRIWHLLDGRQWEVADLETIADIITQTGRAVAEPNEEEL